MADSNVLNDAERALIDLKLPNHTKNISSIVQKVIQGDFAYALGSDEARHLLSTSLETPTITAEILDTFNILRLTLDGHEDEITRLALGVAALHAFIQINWTGPNLTFTSFDVLRSQDGGPLPSNDQFNEESLNQFTIQRLASDGEPAYHLSQGAVLLYIALAIFRLPFVHIKSAPLWNLRAGRVHREILDEPVIFPSTDFERLDKFAELLDPKADADILGRIALEKGLMHHLLRQDKLAADEFVKAANIMGLQYELTGVKGRRTRYQVYDLTQLVLLAKGRDRDREDDTSNFDPTSPKVDQDLDGVEEISVPVPETLSLNDETLLERTEYTSTTIAAHSSESPSLLSQLDPNNQPALHPLDQCVLLGLCLNVKNTSPQHGLTSEQMSPYISRVISHPRNWSVHTMALLLRSRLEANRTRTVERSVLQLQALIDQMPTDDSSIAQRLAYFHGMALPSKWELQRELAMRLIGLGVLKSALEILEKLEMWEEVVNCWQAMEQPARGIAVVKDLLAGRKTEADTVVTRGKLVKEGVIGAMDISREAKLWCLLGELEPDHAQEHFQKAWGVSNHTSGRAVRSLGGYYFARGEYEKAIEELKKAVVIQPLLARSWFILGCALVRKERWREARDAFVRCVMLDEEDGESWNNLASVYLQLGLDDDEADTDKESDTSENALKSARSKTSFENKMLAFRALQQGLKGSHSNWRMWSNYMIVSIDVGELAEACRALGRVIEERYETDGEASVDIEVLERLTNVVTRSSESDQVEGQTEGSARPSNSNEGLGLYARLDDLFNQIILPRISGSPRIWRARAQLLTWRRRWSDALAAYAAAYRCGVAADTRLEVELDRWREAVIEVEEYVDVLRNFAPKAAEERKLKEEKTGEKQKREASWAFQARGVVRTFMGRTRDAFEEEPEWGRLQKLSEELKGTP